MGTFPQPIVVDDDDDEDEVNSNMDQSILLYNDDDDEDTIQEKLIRLSRDEKIILLNLLPVYTTLPL